MSPFYLISPLILQTFIWPGTRLCLWFFGKLEVRGLDNLKGLSRKNGVVFAANHASELDPILVPASLPFLSRFMPIFYTSREKKFYDDMGVIKSFFYGGTFFKLWGSHAVKIGMNDYEKSLETHIDILRAGKSLLIFPEGGIGSVMHAVGVMRPAKGGAVYIALHCKAPIVPIVISGTYGLSAKSFFNRKRKIIVRFLAPIQPDEIVLKYKRENIDYATSTQVILDEIKDVANGSMVSDPVVLNSTSKT